MPTPDESNGGSSRVSGYELLKAMTEMEARQVERFHNMSKDVRSVKQTLDETVLPRLVKVEAETETLRSRFSYALYIIGGAIAAGAFVIQRGLA